MRFLAVIQNRPSRTNIQHYMGMPPELTGGSDQRTLMAMPAFVVIEESDSGVLLYRYDIRGECVGDTWHANVQEAKGQAAYEYQTALGEWQTISSAVHDVIALGIDMCAKS